mgnify:CR=1 FL=1
MAQVAEHNKPDDLWIVIAGKMCATMSGMLCCYVTHVGVTLPTHPATTCRSGLSITQVATSAWRMSQVLTRRTLSRTTIQRMCIVRVLCLLSLGPFDSRVYSPPSYVWQKKAPRFQIGVVADSYQESEFVKEFRTLRQRLLAEGATAGVVSSVLGPFVCVPCLLEQRLLTAPTRPGMYETRPSFYVVYLSWMAVLFCGSLYLALAIKSNAALFFSAVMMGLAFHQMAFFGHDICHNAVSHVKVCLFVWFVSLYVHITVGGGGGGGGGGGVTQPWLVCDAHV